MTTIGDLVNRVITQWVEPGRRHVLTKTTGNVSTADVAITMAYAAGISRGTLVTLDDEEVYVWAYDTVNNQISDCVRGYRGTVATTHPTGTLVELNPRFSRPRILQSLKDEINSWGADLYRVVPVSFTGLANMSYVDLTSTPDITQMLGLVDVRIRRNNVGVVATVSQYDRWPRMTGAHISRDMPAANFPSTVALRLGEILQGPADIRVLAAMTMDTTTFTEATDITTIGLIESTADVACLGAACRLVWGQEIDRSDRTSTGEMRRAQEVTVGQTAQQGLMLERVYLRQLNTEKAKLLSKYPIRIN